MEFERASRRASRRSIVSKKIKIVGDTLAQDRRFVEPGFLHEPPRFPARAAAPPALGAGCSVEILKVLAHHPDEGLRSSPAAQFVLKAAQAAEFPGVHDETTSKNHFAAVTWP